MNGLLHRVAARAAGTAVAVRSDAGLPYAGGGGGLGDVGEAESHFATGAEPLAQMPSASTAHEPERAARPAALPVVADSARTPSPLVEPLIDADVLRDAPQITPNAKFAPRVDSAQPSVFNESRFTPPPSHVALLMPRTTPAAIESAAEAAHIPREVAITAREAMHADEPAPLMPREPRPTLLAPVPQPANRRGAVPQGGAAMQGEADTEVHIHIGRIDVTAIHEAAPQRRRAAAAPAPMSLDGYLAQRGRS